MTFGERIISLRKAKGISQEQLAEKIGVSRQIVHQYEQNETDPRLLIATCMADVLEVSLDYLAKGENQNDEIPLL